MPFPWLYVPPCAQSSRQEQVHNILCEGIVVGLVVDQTVETAYVGAQV